MITCENCGLPITTQHPGAESGMPRHRALWLCIEARKAEIERLRAENEHWLWELAGCLTVAEARQPTEYRSDRPCITLEAVNQLAAKYQAALTRIAELEARLTPVKFSERKPEEAGRYQVVPANSWQWTTTYWNPESVEIREYVLREYAYWLPMPPAPEESA